MSAPVSLTTAVNVAHGILSIWAGVQQGPTTAAEGTAKVNELLSGIYDAIQQWKELEDQINKAAKNTAVVPGEEILPGLVKGVSTPG